jgi:uncharacterized protein (TIGR00369 family)
MAPRGAGGTRDVLGEIRELADGSPFYAWSGMRVVRVAPGEVDVAMEATVHHLNLRGLLHGGMIATLADTASGLAIRSMLEPGQAHATVQMDVQYMAPGGPGPIEARGRVVRMGGSIGFAEAEVIDGEGRTLARATATHAIGRAGSGDPQ